MEIKEAELEGGGADREWESQKTGEAWGSREPIWEAKELSWKKKLENLLEEQREWDWRSRHLQVSELRNRLLILLWSFEDFAFSYFWEIPGNYREISPILRSKRSKIPRSFRSFLNSLNFFCSIYRASIFSCSINSLKTPLIMFGLKSSHFP